MILIFAFIAAIGAGVIGYRAATGYHAGPPAHSAPAVAGAPSSPTVQAPLASKAGPQDPQEKTD